MLDEVKVIGLESAEPSQVVDLARLIDSQKVAETIEGTGADLIRDGHDFPHRWLHDAHAQPDDRKAAFLIGRGWSATLAKRKIIADSGIPVMAVNDYPKDGPDPNYWCSGDPPVYFPERLWTNPKIVKFCAMTTVKCLRPREDAYAPALTTKSAPNVHYFHAVQNCTDVEAFLHTPWINWGTSICAEEVPALYKASARSSMLIGLRLLWHLGYREVFLLGCDCTPHQHDFPHYYETIFHHLEQIKPAFDRYCYSVYQTNPDSHLRIFKMADFDKAIEFCKRKVE